MIIVDRTTIECSPISSDDVISATIICQFRNHFRSFFFNHSSAIHRAIALSLHMRCVAFVLFNRLVVSILQNALWEPLNNSQAIRGCSRFCGEWDTLHTLACARIIRDEWMHPIHSQKIQNRNITEEDEVDCRCSFISRLLRCFCFWYVLFYFISISFSNEAKQEPSERKRRRSWNRREKKKKNISSVAFLRFSFYFCHFYVFRFGLSFRCSVGICFFAFFCFYSIRRCHFYVYFCSVRIYASSIVVSTFSCFLLCLAFRCSTEYTASPSSHTKQCYANSENYMHTVAERLGYIFSSTCSLASSKPPRWLLLFKFGAARWKKVFYSLLRKNFELNDVVVLLCRAVKLVCIHTFAAGTLLVQLQLMPNVDI